MSVEMNVFNASITVTELLTKTLENCAKELATRCIKECAQRYGFDAMEEIRILGLENLSLMKKQMVKKSVAGPKTEKVVKQKKSKIPMPFNKECVDMDGCQGLAYNRGLFTQCDKTRMENGEFCNKCQGEADKNASGAPDCGKVCDRLATGLYDFEDPKGRSPTRYVKLLEKLSINETDAMAEADKMNIILDMEHFIVDDKKKPKGRPKKIASVVEADNVTDLFAKLTMDESEDIESDTDSVKTKKAALSEEEKAAKKAKLEAKKEEKKAERLAAKAAAKEAAKEEKKAERLAAKAAAKEAAKEEKKAERKLAAKAKREAAKAAAKEAAKEKVEEDVEEPVVEKVVEKVVVEPVVEKVVEKVVVEEKQEAKTKVTKFTYNGTNYLKSKENVVYTLQGEEVGVWNPISNELQIIEDEDEEEEEDYDEDEDN